MFVKGYKNLPTLSDICFLFGHFCNVNLLVDLTLLNKFAAFNSLSLFIIIVKIITKNSNTVNSEINARFLLLRKMRLSCKRNNLNSHFEIFYMNLTGFFSKS